MADLRGYDATDHKPLEFEAMPVGWYKAMIVESSMRYTRKGDGQFLELVFQIFEGEYENRKAWARLNLDNPNPKAVEIASRELSSIYRCFGFERLDESEELHDKPLCIKLGQELNKNTNEMTNRIRAYASIDDWDKKSKQKAKPASDGGGKKSSDSDKPPWKR